jgi:outer membrane receptor protein involved in Fe transport
MIVVANIISLLYAQNSRAGTIIGKVREDSTHRPLEFVNVLLLKKADSTLVTGTTTGANGNFKLKNIPSGEYIVKFMQIGYQEKIVSAIILDTARRNINLEMISLTGTTVNLKEVSVTAEKSILDFSIDRKIYNVDQDMMSKAGSASELLENIPSVQVDIDGVVSLRGSSSVLLLLNGKKSPLLEKRGGEFLEQLPANAIEKVEVITNPSAKYKSEGKAGIINIVLKKNTALGTHGKFTANAGNGGRYNGQARLNYNTGDVNIYGNYSVRRDNRNRANIDSRTESLSPNPFVSPSSYYTDYLFSFYHPLSNIFTLGLDYQIDVCNSTGMTGTYVHNYFTRDDSSHRILENGTHRILGEYDRSGSGLEDEKLYSFTTYVQHNFSDDHNNIRLDVNVSGNPNQDDYRFGNDYLLPLIPSTFDNSRIQERDNKTQVTIDYTAPLSTHSLLEAGYAGEFGTTSLDFYAEYFDFRQRQFVEDVAKTSQFLSHESINALYVTYKQSFGSFGLGVGLRAEQAIIEADLITSDSVVTNNYVNLYPTAHLSYKMNNSNEIQLSYSRRTHRPHGRELNPYPEFRDPKNVSKGNPFLTPEYTHSLELGFQFQSDHISVLPSLYYRYSTNHIASIKEFANRSTLLTTKQNLLSNQSAGLEFIFSFTGGDIVTADLSTTGFYEQIDATNVGNGENNSALSCTGALTTKINFTKTSRLQVHSHFRSSRLTSQGESAPSTSVNVGFRQEFFHNRLSLVLNVSDIFKTLKRESSLDIPRLHQDITNTRESRVVFLGFTYHIGGTAKKPREEENNDDDDDEP